MLLEASNNLLVYKPDPSKLINLYPLSHESHYLHADTSNLVAFLDILRDKYRDNFEVIEHDLQKCIPEFSRIQLENVAATNDLIKLYGNKTFKRLGLYNPQQKITYWADELYPTHQVHLENSIVISELCKKNIYDQRKRNAKTLC